MEKIIRDAKRDGYYDLGVMEIAGAGVFSEKPPVLITSSGTPQSSADSMQGNITTIHSQNKVFHNEVKQDRGVTWETSLSLLKTAIENFEIGQTEVGLKKTKRKKINPIFGYFKSKLQFQGRHFVLLIVEKLPPALVCEVY